MTTFSPSPVRSAAAADTTWFAVAIGVSLVGLAAGASIWAAFGLQLAAVAVFLVVAAIGAVFAAQHGRDALKWYASGAIATAAVSYAVVILMALCFMVIARH